MAEHTKSTRRQHSADFKLQVVDACRQPDASVAGVALAHGINANLVRRWLREQGIVASSKRVAAEANVLDFVPVRIAPSEAPPGDIRIELRRAGFVATIHWPVQAAPELGAWLQAWLR
ncbi:transposase [Methyloterricola oryzae]|uniref:transposase n=1 Tax=Methyloterricola oryzae TaxID=1495050 RepID=UPI0005EB2DBB|nr:transposase [Methyloterricola oryzae]